MTPKFPHQVSSEPPVDDPATDFHRGVRPNTGDPEIDELEPAPNTFTGEMEGDPRSKDSFPEFDSPAGVANLIDPFEKTNDGDTVRAEEFSLQMSSNMMADHVSWLPPKPLTTEELKLYIKRGHDTDYRNLRCWVSCEQPYISDMAIGEYRANVDGYILRFDIESAHAPFESYELAPDYSPTGFSWYAEEKEDSVLTTDGQLELSQSRGLDQLLNITNPEEVLNPPARMFSASHLLDTSLYGDEISPTPDGWVTVSCDVDKGHSEPFNTRYSATFVHQPTDIVVEVSPLPVTARESMLAERVAEMAMGERIQGPHDSGEDPREKARNIPSHEFEMSFADQQIERAIDFQFDDKVTGKEVHNLLQRVTELAD